MTTVDTTDLLAVLLPLFPRQLIEKPVVIRAVVNGIFPNILNANYTLASSEAGRKFVARMRDV